MTVIKSARVPIWSDHGLVVYAEDWPTQEIADQVVTIAAAMLGPFRNIDGPVFEQHSADHLADHLSRSFGLDPDAPYGCALIVERVNSQQQE